MLSFTRLVLFTSSTSSALKFAARPSFASKIQIDWHSLAVNSIVSRQLSGNQSLQRQAPPFLSRSTTTITNAIPRSARMVSQEELPQVVFVLGGPGAGKGTQCQRICAEFGYVHLSAGDLLRKERNTPGSQYGDLIEGHIRNGTIVPVEITVSLLENAINETVQAQAKDDTEASGNMMNGGEGGDIPPKKVIGRFLIDGFPRNQNNLEGWQRLMNGKANVQFVIFFDCPEDLCVERCLKRGQAGSGRSDDNEESLKKRLNTYLYQTKPIIDFYEKQNLVKRIDGTGTPDEVYAEVRKLFL